MRQVTTMAILVCLFAACGRETLRSVGEPTCESDRCATSVASTTEVPAEEPGEPASEPPTAGPSEPNCPPDSAWDGTACAPSLIAHHHVDCVPTAGEQGEDLYWIDSAGNPTDLVEDCGYFGHSLNCAGARMTMDGQAKAAASGLNAAAFVGCCGPDASTIDLYGCIPFSQAGEPCFDDLRYFNRCVSGWECRNAATGPYPQTCQPAQ